MPTAKMWNLTDDVTQRKTFIGSTHFVGGTNKCLSINYVNTNKTSPQTWQYKIMRELNQHVLEHKFKEKHGQHGIYLSTL